VGFPFFSFPLPYGEARGGSWLLARGRGLSEFDFPPVLYVDLPLYGMTYTLAVQVVQWQ